MNTTKTRLIGSS